MCLSRGHQQRQPDRAAGGHGENRVARSAEKSIGKVPPIEPGQEDRRGEKHEEDPQSDHAIDQDRGDRLGAMLRVFVVEDHGLQQVTADDAQRGEIEEITPEADADRVE